MEFKLIHVLGPVIATVAMLFYGRFIVGKANGRQIRVGPSLILIAGAILFRQFTGDGTFLDRVCLTLLDFGIAMIIDSAYLAANKEHPKMFWVPGILALVVSFVIYFFASLFGFTVNSMFADEQQPKFERAEVLIELGPDDDISEIENTLSRYDAAWERVFPDVSLEEDADLGNYFMVDLPEGKAADFLAEIGKDTENIDAAELNGAVGLEEPIIQNDLGANAGTYSTNDPGIPNQWWLPAEEVNAAHALLKAYPPKKKAKVAIIDTGVDGTHEDLKRIFGKSPGSADGHGHGTHCAGLAGAETNNGIGMASFNWEGKFIEIRSYAALNRRGQGDHVSLARAIQQAAKDGCDVISMSLGMPASTAPKIVREAADYAFQYHCILVAAAGNDQGMDAANQSPANVQGVIAVSATHSGGHPARFSNKVGNLRMPIAAPGQEIYSTLPDGAYQEMSGTSMATPIVAGLIGVLRAYHPRITKEEAWMLLHKTGQKIAESAEYGRIVQPLELIKAATGN